MSNVNPQSTDKNYNGKLERRKSDRRTEDRRKMERRTHDRRAYDDYRFLSSHLDHINDELNIISDQIHKIREDMNN